METRKKIAIYPTREEALMVARYYLDTEVASPAITAHLMGSMGKHGWCIIWPLRMGDHLGRELIVGYTFLHRDGQFHNIEI